MEPKRREKEGTPGDAAHSEAPSRTANIEKIVAALVEALPAVERKTLDEAVAEVRERPRISLHYLFKNFAASDARVRALVGAIITRHAGPDVVDNLNAIIFDSSQEKWSRVLAGDMLEELGSPMDPDVFEMSVKGAGPLKLRLPSRVFKLLAQGDIAAAVEHARSLEPACRFVTMAQASERLQNKAVPWLEALAEDNEENTIAAVTAIGSEGLADGVPLLLRLAGSGNRQIQKLVKRTLFDLRKAGIPVPEEKEEAPAAGHADSAEEELPLHRVMMSDPSPDGLVLIAVARRRSNGRLKVFSVLVDFWKRGIKQAGTRLEVSKSAFDKFLASQQSSRTPLKDASLEACRKAVARGMRVAKEFGMPLPVDFGLGKTILGDVDREAAALEDVFVCSNCHKSLDEETLRKIRAAAPYDNMRVETRCAECRSR